MPQKHAKGGPTTKATKAKKAGSKAISALQSAGMNPDGDDETGDVEKDIAKENEVPKNVVEKWEELKQGGGDDSSPEDAEEDSPRSEFKKSRFRKTKE